MIIIRPHNVKIIISWMGWATIPMAPAARVFQVIRGLSEA